MKIILNTDHLKEIQLSYFLQGKDHVNIITDSTAIITNIS